jgi:hypothetical protein
MNRHLRSAEVVAYLVAAAFLAACLNWVNTARYMLPPGSGDAAGRAWGYGVGAAVALAVGLILRFVLRLRAGDDEPQEDA